MDSSCRSFHCNSTWTLLEDKKFEDAMARYDKETPGRWHKIATAVGSKTVEEVKRHFDILVKDVKRIESGKVPLPNYQGTVDEGDKW